MLFILGIKDFNVFALAERFSTLPDVGRVSQIPPSLTLSRECSEKRQDRLMRRLDRTRARIREWEISLSLDRHWLLDGIHDIRCTHPTNCTNVRTSAYRRPTYTQQRHVDVLAYRHLSSRQFSLLLNPHRASLRRDSRAYILRFHPFLSSICRSDDKSCDKSHTMHAARIYAFR